MWACARGHREVVETLLSHGADARPLDKLGKSALDIARAKGQAEIVAILERAEAGVPRHLDRMSVFADLKGRAAVGSGTDLRASIVAGFDAAATKGIVTPGAGRRGSVQGGGGTLSAPSTPKGGRGPKGRRKAGSGTP
eukprot:240841-Prymnesium_polylepis.1